MVCAIAKHLPRRTRHLGVDAVDDRIGPADATDSTALVSLAHSAGAALDGCWRRLEVVD